jgi:hypothetical protein
MKYLKIIAIIGVLLVSTTTMCFQTHATAPRYLKLQYQASTHTLKVTVIHFSPATKIHYVYRIEVDKNGAVYQSHLYQKQPRILVLTYTYNVTANPGDVLTVSAYCILWGFIQKTQTITNTITVL